MSRRWCVWTLYDSIHNFPVFGKSQLRIVILSADQGCEEKARTVIVTFDQLPALVRREAEVPGAEETHLFAAGNRWSVGSDGLLPGGIRRDPVKEADESINPEVEDMLARAHRQVQELLTAKKPLLKQLTRLLEREILEGEELRQVIRAATESGSHLQAGRQLHLPLIKGENNGNPTPQ